jgi:hypothetical protein
MADALRTGIDGTSGLGEDQIECCISNEMTYHFSKARQLWLYSVLLYLWLLPAFRLHDSILVVLLDVIVVVEPKGE